MQTFLPDEDFAASAATLDRQRLGKQRVENLQIMRALLLPDAGWANHPATRMWAGHESWLMGYQSSVVKEWTSRGYRDTCFQKTLDLYLSIFGGYAEHPRPEWLGDDGLHLSHRSNLLRKAPDHYRQFWPADPDDLEYVWPD